MLRLLLPALAMAAGVTGSRGPTARNAGADPVRFTVRVENVSTDRTLRLSNGTPAPAPTAPVLWLVHSGKAPLFTVGAADRGLGLESLAEDDNPSGLAESLAAATGTIRTGFVNTPKGAKEAGPILPGNAYEFEVSVSAAQRLTLAFMFGQSNDLFYSTDVDGLALFDKDGKPLSGDFTSKLTLWDAGTESNQEPGLGADQAPRQKADNTGQAENGVVRVAAGAYPLPKTTEVVRVTITPVR
ncbi:MAG: spondin domain-containing protein [Gemmatimonadetes bacterium]|nr:spondin domain-containing protein [Gemmatimonadota bacterium]